ncbi:unnamed protein product [Arabis nemorensis]|uniref:Uncharacterized protein n=1 Tax=Arabis nemorensis TaxID=586526 RepID=A0A565CR38_9BRAS|nr:unnamed protein product [Arabis nemorensis]
MLDRRVITLGNAGSNNNCWVEFDDEDRGRKVLYMQELIEGGHLFEKCEWPGGFAGLDLVEVEEKVDMVEHEKHVINRKGLINEQVGDFVDEKVVNLKRKCKKKKQIGSKRKQRKLESYFPPATRTSTHLKEWMKSQLEELKSTLTEKIYQHDAEIKRLKKRESVGRKSFGSFSQRTIRSNRRRKSVLDGTPRKADGAIEVAPNVSDKVGVSPGHGFVAQNSEMAKFVRKKCKL